MTNKLLIGCGTTALIISMIVGVCVGLVYRFLSPHFIEGHYLRNGKVYFSQGALGGLVLFRANYLKEISDADYDSFQILKNHFAKDKNNVYYRSFILPNGHPATFKVVQGFYAVDQNQIYYESDLISNLPQSFKIIADLGKRGLYATDKEIVFRSGKPIFKEIADAETFENINSTDYFHDKNRVYKLLKEIKDADPQTFKILSGYNNLYAVDKTNVFYDGKKVEGCELQSHQIIDLYRHRDSKSVFVKDRKISDDPDNFQILSKNDGFTKDSKNAFWRIVKISDDATNFKVISEKNDKGIARDGYSVYWCAIKLDEVDAESFVVLNNDYAKDKNNVYFLAGLKLKPKIVKDADIETFQIQSGGNRYDAKDKNTHYYQGFPRKIR